MSKISKVEFEMPSARSTLAFLFLPEFKRAFPAFDHIKPIFIRTIALMFAQAGLLRPNHPATMYGLVKNGPKFNFADLFGEAWYNIRVGEGTTLYHYGLFFGIVIMICTTVAGFFLFITNMALSAAQAQIFDHPTIADTSMAAVPAFGGGLFDNTATSPDLGITLLDKVLRQPVLANGGALQNALGPLMNTYNTAILLIAAVLVFWSIIAILLDTARTGQIGGGRHSMVWVPIRFIFSMGLLIPLASGFNSGQLVVMKIAEWGSNLGSNGWDAYVTSVIDGALVPPVVVDEQADMAVAFARVLACTTAVNMSYDHSNGGAAIDPDLRVLYRVQGGADGVDYASLAFPGTAKNKHIVYVGNRYLNNFCGEIQFLNPNYDELVPVADEPRNTYRKISRDLRVAHRDAFFAMEGAGKNLACSLVMDYQQNFGATTTCAGANGDGSVPAYSDGIFGNNVVPDHTAIDDMMNAHFDPGNAASPLNAAMVVAGNDLVLYVTGGTFLTQVREMGWAGMGLWYHKITNMSDSLSQVNAAFPTVKNGRLEKIVSRETFMALFRSGKTREAKKKAKEMLEQFDKWWMTTAGAAPVGSRVGRFVAEEPNAEPGGESMSGSANVFMDALSKVIGPKDLLITFEGTGGVGVYPMSALASFGDKLMLTSLAGFGAIAAIDAAAGAQDGGILGFLSPLKPFTGAIAGVLAGEVGEAIGTILSLMLVSAMVLKYYIPLLPWIRVTFSVLSWIISVFEFVVIMPILCLANLNTQGDGLFTQGARNMWVGAFNILMRPILTVIGFVGAILIFNAILLYVNDTFNATQRAIASKSATGFADFIAFNIIYVIIVYMLATTTYKLIDTTPNLVMKWMGGPQDDAYQDSNLEGFIVAGGRMAQGAGGGAMKMSTRTGSQIRKAKQSGAGTSTPGTGGSA